MLVGFVVKEKRKWPLSDSTVEYRYYGCCDKRLSYLVQKEGLEEHIRRENQILLDNLGCYSFSQNGAVKELKRIQKIYRKMKKDIRPEILSLGILEIVNDDSRH